MPAELLLRDKRVLASGAIRGFNFHRLRGKPVRYSVHVNGPWTITCEFHEGGALRVDLEQYHWSDRNVTREYTATKRPKMPPTHPGAILREDVLPALRMPVSQAARELRVSRQTLHGILTERKSITAEMALRIGKFAGNGPDLWLRMQQAHDLWRLERKMADELAKIPEHLQQA